MRYITLFFCLFLISCGARKVNVDKIDSVVKTDSTSVTKKETISAQDNHVSIVTDTDEFEVCPLSDSIPMVVNGITYKNAKIRYKKTKKVFVDTTKIKVSEKVLIKANVKKNTSVKAFKKDVDKKESHLAYWLWLWILILAILIFYFRNKLFKILP
jgi:hypothetical protein